MISLWELLESFVLLLFSGRLHCDRRGMESALPSILQNAFFAFFAMAGSRMTVGAIIENRRRRSNVD
uniref:Uncharacterized protein n=1 Tax=Anopheles darlingi TaxID=43151 RepID=A0A2M4D9E8_ANODA